MADILNSIIHSSDNAVNGLYNAMEIRRQRQQDTRQGQMDQRNAMVQDRNFNEDVKAQAWGRAQSVILGGGTREQALSVLADASRQYGLPMPAPEVGALLEKSAYGSMAGSATEAPSNVREYEYYNSLSPEGQKQFLLMKRAGVRVDLGGGGVGMLEPGAAAPRQVVAPEQATALDAAQAGSIASAKEGAKIAAIPEAATATREQERLDRQAITASTLPQAREVGGRALKVLEDIKTHPGLQGGTGFDWKRSKIPGTKEYDFAAKIRQAQGGAFLEARQALKGGGAVTDMEGIKAEQALANLDQAQSAESFLTALADYEGAIVRGFALLEQQAGKQPTGLTPVTNDPVSALQQNLGSKMNTSVDLPVGSVDGGYVYQGGDPSKPESWKKQ